MDQLFLFRLEWCAVWYCIRSKSNLYPCPGQRQKLVPSLSFWYGSFACGLYFSCPRGEKMLTMGISFIVLIASISAHVFISCPTWVASGSRLYTLFVLACVLWWPPVSAWHFLTYLKSKYCIQRTIRGNRRLIILALSLTFLLQDPATKYISSENKVRSLQFLDSSPPPKSIHILFSIVIAMDSFIATDSYPSPLLVSS